jgi:hypothetical protein
LKQLALNGADPNAILTELDHQLRAINQPQVVLSPESKVQSPESTKNYPT